MTSGSIFEAVKVQQWFDVDGLLKAWKPETRAPRPKRKLAFAASVAAAATVLGMNLAHTIAVPVQAAVTWPTEQTPASTREALQNSLNVVRGLPNKWDGRHAPKPNQRSVQVTEYILPQLPDIVAEARAGIDDEGNVFLRLARSNRVAYLTVEPRSMHLLFVEEGQRNVYIDDEPFNGKILPANIKRILDERL